MVAKVFDDILLKGIRSGQMPARTQEARKWYRDQAATVSKKQAEGTKLIKEMGRDRYENRFRLGNMYTFMYDPKHKADKSKLPYYDNYPLIFPINKAKGPSQPMPRCRFGLAGRQPRPLSELLGLVPVGSLGLIPQVKLRR